MEGRLEQVETNRAPASAFLCIDSQDRIQSSSLRDPAFSVAFEPETVLQPINNFTIYKRQPFLTGYFHRIAVTECRFEMGIPNVNVRNNLIVVVDASSVIHTIEIPEGFYTPVELAAELDSQLTADIPTQTWDVQFTGDRFEIESDADFTISPHLYDSAEQTVRGLFFMMNFSYVNTGFFNPQTTQVSMYHPPMMYTRYIDVCSRTLTQYQKVKDNSTRENQTPAILARIYLTNDSNPNYPGSRGTVIQRIWNVPKYSSWSPGQFIDQIDIQLRDDAGNLLYIPYNDFSGELTSKEDAVAATLQNQNSFQLTLHCSES